MIRKIVVNLIAGFVIFPMIIFFKDLALIKELWYFGYGYSYDRNVLYDYVRIFINEYMIEDVFFLGSIFFTLLILVPFQLVKNYYYNRNGKGLRFLKKSLILWGLLSVVFAFLFRPPMTEVQERIELFVSLLSIASFFTLLLYFTIDRFVEKARKQADTE